METEKITKETSPIDRFYKLYREGRKENAPQNFIDYFKASHFLLIEIDKALSQQREDIVEIIQKASKRTMSEETKKITKKK